MSPRLFVSRPSFLRFRLFHIGSLVLQSEQSKCDRASPKSMNISSPALTLDKRHRNVVSFSNEECCLCTVWASMVDVGNQTIDKSPGTRRVLEGAVSFELVEAYRFCCVHIVTPHFAQGSKSLCKLFPLINILLILY